MKYVLASVCEDTTGPGEPNSLGDPHDGPGFGGEVEDDEEFQARLGFKDRSGSSLYGLMLSKAALDATMEALELEMAEDGEPNGDQEMQGEEPEDEPSPAGPDDVPEPPSDNDADAPHGAAAS